MRLVEVTEVLLAYPVILTPFQVYEYQERSRLRNFILKIRRRKCIGQVFSLENVIFPFILLFKSCIFGRENTAATPFSSAAIIY